MEPIIVSVNTDTTEMVPAVQVWNLKKTKNLTSLWKYLNKWFEIKLNIHSL